MQPGEHALALPDLPAISVPTVPPGQVATPAAATPPPAVAPVLTAPVTPRERETTREPAEHPRGGTDANGVGTLPIPSIDTSGLSAAASAFTGVAGPLGDLASLFSHVGDSLRATAPSINDFGRAVEGATARLGELLQAAARTVEPRRTRPLRSRPQQQASIPEQRAIEMAVVVASMNQTFNITQVFDPRDSVGQLAARFRQMMDAQQRQFDQRVAAYGPRQNTVQSTAGDA